MECATFCCYVDGYEGLEWVLQIHRKHLRLSPWEMNILQLWSVFRNCSSYNFSIGVIANVISQGIGIFTPIWARKKSIWEVLWAEKENQSNQCCVYESQETWSLQRCLHPNSWTFACVRLHGNRPAHTLLLRTLRKRFTGINEVGQIKSFMFIKVES